MHRAAFCFIFALIASVSSEQHVPLTRRQNPAATGKNPFASITPSKTLRWVPCYEDSGATEFGPLSCARLIAPLDYANTSLGTVQLAIIKLGAIHRVESARNIFFNPGGPGGDPVNEILTDADLLRTQVGNHSNIIAIVPRAIGSTFPPITCDTTDAVSTRREDDIEEAQPGYTNRSINESYAIGESLGLDCASVTPKLVSYAGTYYAAHDMDFVLQKLGDQKLSYLGHSYGTVLGGTYAALFPVHILNPQSNGANETSQNKVDRMVLDGVLDFNDWYNPYQNPQLDIGDADLALHNFFQACYDAGPKKCALWAPTYAKIRARFLMADSQILQKPLPVPGFGLLKTPLWRSGVYQSLYRPDQGFPLLAAVATEILNGTAGPGTRAYLEIVEASPTERPLTDPETGLKNGPTGSWIVSCGDRNILNDATQKDLDYVVAEYSRVSNFFGGLAAQYSLLCMGAKLVAEKRYTGNFTNIHTANPILFIGNVADPTTPIRNARGMSAAFPSSRVLTINGTGHISFRAMATGDTECARRWIVPYFETGVLPPRGMVCEGRQDPFGAGDEVVRGKR